MIPLTVRHKYVRFTKTGDGLFVVGCGQNLVECFGRYIEDRALQCEEGQAEGGGQYPHSGSLAENLYNKESGYSDVGSLVTTWFPT